MGLTTLVAAKIHLGVSGTSDDAVITAMIAEATKMMETAAHRHLESESVTKTFSGRGSYRLYLPEPAESVTSIHVSDEQEWTSANLVASTGYVVDSCMIERLDQIWTKGQRNIRVIFLGGYVTTPDDLARACKRQVAQMYSEWAAEKDGTNILESRKVESWQEKWIEHRFLDQQVEAICNLYHPGERL